MHSFIYVIHYLEFLLVLLKKFNLKEKRTAESGFNTIIAVLIIKNVAQHSILLFFIYYFFSSSTEDFFSYSKRVK